MSWCWRSIKVAYCTQSVHKPRGPSRYCAGCVAVASSPAILPRRPGTRRTPVRLCLAVFRRGATQPSRCKGGPRHRIFFRHARTLPQGRGTFRRLRQVSHASRKFPRLTELPAGVRNFPQACGTFRRRTELPAGVRKFPQAYGSSRRRTELPAGVRKFPQAYGTSRRRTELPAGVRNFPQAYGSSRRRTEVPAGVRKFPQAYGISRRRTEVPAGVRKFLRADSTPIFPRNRAKVKVFRFFRRCALAGLFFGRLDKHALMACLCRSDKSRAFAFARLRLSKASFALR
jgi:hypothetical protein